MKKKSLLITLLMAFFAPLAMNGQQTATFNEGTNTSSYLPFYGMYADYGTKGQFIIPATDLANKGITSGSQISKLTFYSNATSTGTFFGSSRIVEVGEVSYLTFGTNTNTFVTSGLTTVLSGAPNTLTRNSDGTMEVSFSSNYTYNGGNLLISIGGYGSNYKSTSWYGVNTNNAGVYGNQSYSNSGSIPTTSTMVSFAPKTTITYIPGSTPYLTLNPTSATVLTGFTETLTASYGNVTGTPSITYTSSNNSVATVSGSGTSATVTGVAPGTATITASMTYEGEPYTATCEITVEDPSYCTPTPSSVDGKGITTLTFGSGDYEVNNSNSNGLPSSSPYYADYTSMVGGYEPGETATVTITYSTGTGTVYSYGTLIWVDWNKNYTFEDSEIVYTGTSAQGSGGTPQVLTATFTVPANQVADDYRMRVAGADSYFDNYISGTTSANHDPCFTSTYAVCHDYTLRVVSNSNCPTPTITDITATANSATITTDSEASSFNVRYREYVEATSTTYDFEEDWQGWTALQGTNGTSPHNWMHNTEYTAYSSNGSVIDLTTSGYNSSAGFMLSESYISAATSGGTATGAVYPDNYLISPQISLGGSMTFYAAGRTTDCAEKFTVMVSTTTDINDFEATSLTVTLSSQTYTQYTVDLSDYSGMGYVIFHHYDCTDQHMLKIDDVTIVAPSMQWQTGNDLTITGLEPATTYEVQVQANCGDEDGLSNWSTVATFTTLEIPAVPVESITVTPDEIYPTVGATYSIVYTVLPADATNPAVTFSSSDEDVATVDENGTVTAVAAGTATITIAATDGSGVTGTLTVNVMNIDVEEITAQDITMITSGTATINYQVLPEQATDKSVTFTSANTAIATVDENGVVTGVAVGETTITIASVQNPDVTTDITVTVISDPNAVLFTLNVDKTAAAPGDVITVEAYLNAPESGDYNGFTGLVLGLHFDPTAFAVDGDPVKGSVANASSMAMTALPNETHPDLVQCSCVMPVGTPNTTTGLVFTVQFTVLTEVELGSYTFYAEPTAANNFVYNPDVNIGPSNIQYEYVPSTVEVGYFYTKEITAYSGDTDHYYFIASPVTNAITPSADNGFLTSDYDLYYFNQDGVDGLEWINWENNGALNGFDIINGMGYLYASSTNTTLVFSGEAYSGNGEVELTYSTSNADANMHGWNLVGNPFADTAYIDMPFYTLDGEDDYVEHVAGDPIYPMQGVLIQTTQTTTLTFSTTAPAGKNANLVLNLTKDCALIDRAIVNFGEGESLTKFQLNPNHTKIYMSLEGNDYAVVYTEEQGVMPVNFKAENNGTYTLSFTNEEVSFGYLHLIDNMTGNDVDLLATPSYSFDAKTTDYESRFKLVFATGNADDTFAFYSNGSFVINNPSTGSGPATLQVIDMNGRILKSESINGCANVNVKAAAGVYVLRLVNGDNVKVQKVVVR
jgi:uncharacterized protein YjdB